MPPAIHFWPRDAMQVQSMLSCGIRLSSVTFVNSVKMSNRIVRLFSRSGSQTILVFTNQTLWPYSDGDHLMASSNVGSKIAILDDDWWTIATIHCAVYRTDGDASVNLCLSQPACTTTTKRTQQNLFIRSGKSLAEVTNNRRLRSTNCTTEAIDRHQASRRRLCDSRATCSLTIHRDNKGVCSNLVTYWLVLVHICFSTTCTTPRPHPHKAQQMSELI